MAPSASETPETKHGVGETIRTVTVHGSAFECGKMYGEQVAPLIHRNLTASTDRLRGIGQLWSTCMAIVNEVYIPGLQKYWPRGYEELSGMAEGADVDLDDLVLLNARDDLNQILPQIAHGDVWWEDMDPDDPHGYGKFLLGQGPVVKPIWQPDGDNRSSRARHGVVLGPVKPERCPDECTTAFFLSPATQNRNVISAQNWDKARRFDDPDFIINLEVQPTDGRPAMLITTEAGMLMGSGMNSAGMAVTWSSMKSQRDFVPVDHEDPQGNKIRCKPRPMLPFPFLRRMLLEGWNMKDVVDGFTEIPRHLSGNMTVADKHGTAFTLEIIPNEIYRVEPITVPFLLHTNHFLNHHTYRVPGTADRMNMTDSARRLNAAEAELVCSKFLGNITPDRVVEIFSGHREGPLSLCKHGREDDLSAVKTVAFVMYNLVKMEAFVCKGPPCSGVITKSDL
ncbi:acyl-coenzyme A:6-aminopenicillanic acid acyl-transferase-domain-containing protein [Lasiosphaeria miniovina]|uniref:Acyl-coenzyme A:6-aminopenicillanic acid acyl-transferase-domain-containing protein n=1 Tax=Lasiosphaeria miniovina TaxID=1954250 RepID=A0AA40B3L7_9PEZI|nr:acyl-coenzyme A:6-aminopenicillanic acid acyl-transferase-domain-containing protein [Lasiosphaeria miniovina]KAK0727063.1 acyl-coenzyme A:6-aminopenicillanic acid acyl-transferase-domain-containing protein [Lasiosphaeria miniovina]